MLANTESPATVVTIAALVKMVNLLGAELTVGKHREDIDLIERCVRAKLFAHVDGVSASDHAAGVALAHSLVEPVLRDLRGRVERLHGKQAPAPAVAEAIPAHVGKLH
jgi:hypothetical protein